MCSHFARGGGSDQNPEKNPDTPETGVENGDGMEKDEEDAEGQAPSDEEGVPDDATTAELSLANLIRGSTPPELRITDAQAIWFTRNWASVGGDGGASKSGKFNAWYKWLDEGAYDDPRAEAIWDSVLEAD